MKAEKDSVTLTYAFGTDSENQNICYVMSADAYHELEERAEKAIEAGTLNRLILLVFSGYIKLLFTMSLRMPTKRIT